MNYKETLTTFMTIFVILKRAESELVAEIIETEHYSDPAVGKDHTLYCRAVNANDVVSLLYRWKINNKTITDTDMRYDRYDSYLIIRQITKEDKNMTIQCQVVSAINDDRSEFSAMVVLNPRYGPSTVSIIPAQRTLTISENKQLFLKCSADCHPQCIYGWFFRSKGSTSKTFKRIQSGKNLVRKVKPKHAGTFVCAATSPDSDIENRTKSALINVLVNYGPVSVNVSPRTLHNNYNAIEGKMFGPLNCSADCFPICSYKWRFRSQTGGSYKHFTNSSALNINTTKRDNAGLYKCIARNIKLNKKKSTVVTVNVHFGPNNVSLSNFQTNITVKEWTRLRRIECAAECGTSCEYTWTKNSRRIKISKYIFDKTVDPSDIGNYTCYVENLHTGQTKASESFVLNILYGPKNTRILMTDNTPADSVISKVRGSSIGDLFCSAECNPACYYTWTSDSNNFTRNGEVLSLGTATLDKDGTYLCTAMNGFGSQTTRVTVVVEEYGIKLSNSSTFLETPFTVVEGTSLHLECHAKCFYSRCYYRWVIRTDRQHFTLNNLFFPTVKRNQSGTYQCYDSYKQQMETLQIIVQYVPSITNVRLTRPYRIIGRKDVEIKKGSDLELECQVDSIPASNITWQKSDNQMILTSVANMTKLLYSKEGSACEDIGTYTCEARNGIGDTVKRSINVYVRCPPHLTPGKRRKMKSKYERKLGSHVMFTAESTGYPPVEARWFYKYNRTSEENLIHPTENNISSMNGVFSLHIGQITEENYGIYVLELNNEEGNLSFRFALEQPKSIVSASDNMGSTNNNRSGLGSFIGGVVAGIGFLCLVVIGLVIILMRKRANSRREESSRGPEGCNRNNLTQFYHDNSNYAEIDMVTNGKEYKDIGESSVFYNTTCAMNHNCIDGEQCQDTDVELQRKNSYTYAQVQKRNSKGSETVGVEEFDVKSTERNSYTYAEVQKGNRTGDATAGIEESDLKSTDGNSHTYAEVQKRNNTGDATAGVKESDLKSTDGNNDTYAEVEKRNSTGGATVGVEESDLKSTEGNSDTYAEVHKHTTTEGKGKFHVLPVDDEQVYSNVEKRHTEETLSTDKRDKSTIQNIKGGKGTKKSGANTKSKPKIKPKPQAMNYIEVDFQLPASKNSKSVIHGAENRTKYSLVDFTKNAEPLSESEIQEEDEKPRFTTTEEGSLC